MNVGTQLSAAQLCNVTTETERILSAPVWQHCLRRRQPQTPESLVESLTRPCCVVRLWTKWCLLSNTNYISTYESWLCDTPGSFTWTLNTISHTHAQFGATITGLLIFCRRQQWSEVPSHFDFLPIRNRFRMFVGQGWEPEPQRLLVGQWPRTPPWHTRFERESSTSCRIQSVFVVNVWMSRIWCVFSCSTVEPTHTELRFQLQQ